jgi:hypothetical protein
MAKKKPEAAAVWCLIDDLTPWEDNPRVNDAAVEHVRESIKRFGFASPIVARKADGMVIAGHTRLRAATELGLDRVPVRFLDLDPADARMLALADNRIGEVADWDDDLLRKVMEDLANEPDLDLSVLGWDEDELSALMGEDPEGSEEVYTAKVESPIYEPTGDCPEEADLYDEGKARDLIARIQEVDLPDEVRAFLLAAAARHTVFRYDRIAEYYAHAPPETQELMEDSALVIIDFHRAVELGFVKLSGELANAFKDEHDAE